MRRVLLVLLLLLYCAAAPAAAEPLPEDELKAAFLFKFGNYIEWPPGTFATPHSAIVIGIAGDAAIADALHQLIRGRRIAERPLRVLRLDAHDDPVEVHILFVGRDDRYAMLLQRTAQRPVLTVTDQDAFEPAPYSTISFVRDGNRLRFDVALDEARRRGVRINARLLAVARRIHGRPA